MKLKYPFAGPEAAAPEGNGGGRTRVCPAAINVRAPRHQDGSITPVGDKERSVRPGLSCPPASFVGCCLGDGGPEMRSDGAVIVLPPCELVRAPPPCHRLRNEDFHEVPAERRGARGARPHLCVIASDEAEPDAGRAASARGRAATDKPRSAQFDLLSMNPAGWSASGCG
jgi:hypothetical protein